MAKLLKIAMAQLNFHVGDIIGNSKKIIESSKNAQFHLGADAIVFPELALTGYPPEDLLLRPRFLELIDNAMLDIVNSIKGIDVVLGFPKEVRDGIYNAVALIRNGKIVAEYYKHCLPNYSVFDEKRYFLVGKEPCVVEINSIPVGLTICEDIWFKEPMSQALAAGAKLLININASPFHMDKTTERLNLLKQRTSESPIPVMYVNLVGGQDELVFDGESFIVDKTGKVCKRVPAFEEGVYVAEFNVDSNKNVTPVNCAIPKLRSDVETVYQALVTGVRDYVNKNRFPGILIGVSGGIDSGLTLAIAVDAIGAERVEAVMMPSRYTSQMSLEDARKQAQNLETQYREYSIEPVFQAVIDVLREEFAGKDPDTTEENIQARCRGLLLMALSNKSGKIVLTTGNKSEMAVGYATLYGDMVGGFNALKDVPKTLVYRLAEFRNTISPVIPLRVIHRAPSAELSPDQKDSDTLPDYGELDGILERFVEQDKSIAEIVNDGYDRAVVERVIKMVDLNEYKRRQSAPGVKITRRAFSRDRRYPITSGFKSFS